MRCWRWLSSRQERPLAGASRQDRLPGTWEVHARYIGLPGILLPGIQATCGAENLCHQAIFVGDATHAVMPPDPEMLTAALLLLAAGRARRQAAES